MEDMIRTLISVLRSNDKLMAVIATAGVYVALTVFIFRSRTGQRLLRNFRFFFYSEPDSDSSTATRLRLIELEQEVALLRKSLTDKNLQSRRDAIQAEMEKQLTRELPELVKRKLDEIRALDESMDSSIRLAVDQAISSFLEKLDPTRLLSDRREHLRTLERIERSKILETTIEEQMRSSSRLKAVMINLFVLFNIGVLLVYLFVAANLSDRAVTAITGLYVSLAAFIVYIYRTSNFRSSVLLALREDAKKYFDADDYIRRLKQGASPSDRDVEVLKLLLLNRAEREKMANHPYEVVFKGVANSNIQTKGGKMIVPAKGEK
jgi:hypothetical protein